MRFSLVIALALVVAGSAQGRTESLHSLRTVEKAFYAAHTPFATDWQPNPYLEAASPRAELRPRFRPHLVGWAGAVNSTTFKGGQVWIFDGEAIADSYASWNRAHCSPRPSCGRSTLRANNVVYAGTMPLKRVKAAMRKLRHE
jgi:hypothetical protein